jgi:hypothetical protein
LPSTWTNDTGSIWPTTNNAGSIGHAANVFASAYIKDLFVTDAITPPSNNTASVGTPTERFQAVNAENVAADNATLTNLSTSNISLSSQGIIPDGAGGIEAQNGGIGITQTLVPSGSGSIDTQARQILRQVYFFTVTSGSPVFAFSIPAPSGVASVIFGKVVFTGRFTYGSSPGQAMCIECNFAGHSNGTTMTSDLSTSSGIVPGSAVNMSSASCYFAASGNALAMGIYLSSGSADFTAVVDWTVT